MMTKILLNLVLVITILSTSDEIMAQNKIALATKKAKLQALSEKIKKRDINDRRQAQEFSRRMGIPVRRELPNGKVLEIQRISPDSGPIFYITNNAWAADTVSTLQVWPEGSVGLNLNGDGMTVGEWDAGAIFAHPDLIGRVSQQLDILETNELAPPVSAHSTHVAGTLIATGELLDPDLEAGVIPRARGMAYTAHLDAYDWNSDAAEMALAASNGLLISNHSYGIAAGWVYLGGLPPNTWWWIGGAEDSDIEDPSFGYYDADSQLWDQIAFDAPYYLIVKAAGNDRADTGPAPGEEYIIMDSEPDAEGNPQPLYDNNGDPIISTLPRNADCSPPAGYDCLPTSSVAKNILTVGAVNDLPGGYTSLSQVQMTPFSGWGPTDDGRIKPDVMGNGEFLISTWPESPFYAAASGTSMAAPNVTGSLLLLQEHYQNIHGIDNFMRSATLKALAIHTADDAGNAGPDYAFGWGLLNTKKAAQVISEDGGDHRIIEGSLADGAVDTIEINIAEADTLLTATLVWTDPAGTPVTLSLDAPDIMLVNDLDLRIKRVPSTYMPWILNPADPAASATKGDNFRDNVEQVEAVSNSAGIYRIEISHKGTLLNSANQDYSLITSVTPAPLTGESSLLIDEDFSGGLPAGWSVETTSGAEWTINTPVADDPRLDNFTGGTGLFAMVDSNYSNITLTSLRTPILDLSTATGVTLRLKSYFWFDFLETVNVDISTNDGIGWTTVWQQQGTFPTPTNLFLDLSAAAAGHASVILRFRYDSESDTQGNLWQIDDVELEVFEGTPSSGELPGEATNIFPADGGIGLGLNTTLAWSAGSLATSHDVYFGTDSTPDATESWGNQTGTTFAPGPLTSSTTYYWRIDEINANGTTTGNTWSFTTEAASVSPGVASNPNPIEGATNVSINNNLSWTAGLGATSHNVFFNGVLQGYQTTTTFDPGTLAYATSYNWRIDEVNANGTTTGNTWSFITETAPLPNTPPTASFSYSCKKTVCTFTNTSSDPDAGDSVIESNWDFGGDNTSTSLNPVHDFLSFGEHAIYLTVKDNNLTASATVSATFTALDTNKPVKGTSGATGGGSGGNTGGSGPTETGRKCSDGKDNDRDGLTDTEDPDCQ